MATFKPSFLFKTEGGLITFNEEKRYFIFNNPKTNVRPEDEKDKRDTIVFMNVLRSLVQGLPEAKRIAKEYLNMVSLAEPTERETLDAMEGEIYNKVLSCFEGNSSSRAIQHVLMVSVFNGNPYIWLKRFFKDDDEEWKACRGGFWFSMNDDEEAILAYAKECIDYVDEKRKLAKGVLEGIKARLMPIVATEEKEDEEEEGIKRRKIEV